MKEALLVVTVLLGMILPRLSIVIPRRLLAEVHWEGRFAHQATRPPRVLSRQHTAIGASFWLLYALLVLSIDAPIQWHLLTLALGGGLGLGAWIDYQTGLLPFRISLALGVVGFLYQSIEAPEYLALHGWTAIAVFASLTALNQVAWRVKRITVLGGGDVVLLTCLATVIPYTGLLFALWIASLTGWIEAKIRGIRMIRFGPHLAYAILSYWVGAFMLG